MGTKIVFFGGLRFLSSVRLEVSGSLQLETVFHVIYVFKIEKYDTSLHVVIQMEANKFFLVVIADFFDSNFQGKNFDISFTQRFYSK